jgi:uncharacterized protein (DUF58 family)
MFFGGGKKRAPESPRALHRSGFLNPTELAQLASLDLRARTIVEGAFAGMHRNLHPGTSMEFTEHKEYAPGDEIRRIDWKAVGRGDRYFVKRFEDETEMHAVLVVDTSASMGYRRLGVSKLDYASTLAGALAYLLGKQGDAAGLLLFDVGLRKYLPPTTRPGQIREVYRMLEEAQPSGRTEAAQALSRMGELLEKRSLIIFMSDLLDAEPDLPGSRAHGTRADVAQGPVADGLRQLRARGHDVALFHLLDPDEVELPFQDLVFFEGMEPDDSRTLLVEAADLTETFRRESAALRDRWRSACLESRVEYRFTTTDTPPGEVLRAFVGDRHNGPRHRE